MLIETSDTFLQESVRPNFSLTDGINQLENQSKTKENQTVSVDDSCRKQAELHSTGNFRPLIQRKNEIEPTGLNSLRTEESTADRPGSRIYD